MALRKGNDQSTTGGSTQRRYVLYVGLGIVLFTSLGLMAETWQNMLGELWHSPGAANVLQRRLRNGWPSGWPRRTLLGGGPVSVSVERPLKGTKLVSAINPSRCVDLPAQPRNGLIPRIGECSEAARFQLPEGSSGPIRLVEDPSLCLDAPNGHLLQLWSCDARSKHMDFTLHPEPAGWIGVPHFYLPDVDAAEHMDASDLGAVAQKAGELGYEGFSVFNGTAFLTKVDLPAFLEELEYMGTGDLCCVFYFRRARAGDVSIRLTAQPETCLHAAPSDGKAKVGMAPCSGNDQSVHGGAWTAGMLFRVEGGAKDDSDEKETKKEERAEDAGSLSRLIMVLDVANVDFEKLNMNEPLTTRFKNVIQQDVATMTGLQHENLELVPGPGSVQAIHTLVVPETSSAKDARSVLQLDMLSERVASNIRSVEGIDSVSTGHITVTGYKETGGQDAGVSSAGDITVTGYRKTGRDAGVLLVPLVILLGICAAVLVAAVVAGRLGRKPWDVALAPKEETGDNQMPEGGHSHPPAAAAAAPADYEDRRPLLHNHWSDDEDQKPLPRVDRLW